MHQPSHAWRSASTGVGVSSPPERCSASWASTFWAQYHCTTPMWCARSRTVHSGHDGTRAPRSEPATTSANRRLSVAMASICPLKSYPTPLWFADDLMAL